MKKVFLMMLLFVSIFANAQKDVTKFLGIPVDGSKKEMKRKLKAKGFTYNAQYDNFKGEFNGQDVIVSIVTNKNKVWRITVCDANHSGEANIKIKYNNLCDQFARNKKYKPIKPIRFGGYKIPENENISYEMQINKKTYEAAYFQVIVDEKAKEVQMSEFTQEQLDSPLKEGVENIEQEVENDGSKSLEAIIAELHRLVWFKIIEHSGKYYIAMFYDNEYNHADGEDL